MSGALVPQSAFPTGADFDSMRNAAAIISRSGLVPEAFRGKPEDVMVAILTARGLGLDPMVALQKGYVVKGKFDIEVSVKLGLIQSRVPDFDYEVVRLDDDACTVRGGRAGKNPVEVTFTYAQAERAGLTKSRFGDKETWQFYRRDMLFNRALGRVLKMTCAAALYNMPVLLDEEPEGDPRSVVPTQQPGPAHEFVGTGRVEASGAEVVVESAPVTVAQAAANAEANAKMDAITKEHEDHARAVNGLSQPVPVDWLGRLLNAIRAHYGIKAGVPDALPGRNKWLKSANGTDGKLVRLLNLFYEGVGEPAIDGWLSVPPMDYERIALWLEEQAAKRAGAGAAGSGGTDAPPAQVVDAGEPEVARESEPAGESMAPQPASEAPWPEEEEFPANDGVQDEPAAVSGAEYLAGKDLGHVVNVLFAMKHATKNERVFVERSPKGSYALRDAEMLKACGLVDENNAPKPVWLHKAIENKPLWLLICRATADEANRLKVSYL